jgi:hypothetical protein
MLICMPTQTVFFHYIRSVYPQNIIQILASKIYSKGIQLNYIRYYPGKTTIKNKAFCAKINPLSYSNQPHDPP